VILVSESCGTHDHILVPNGSGSCRTLSRLSVQEELIVYFILCVTDHIENESSNNLSIVACIRCSGNIIMESLPSNEGNTHRDTETDERDL
jgi:hypothetical protein